MSSAPTPSITPAVLAWARAESGYDVEQVAKRLQVKVERVRSWESGDRQPTLRQLESLAKFFHRPFSIFFLPRPPQLAPLAAEYRRLPSVEPGHESPERRLALRQMLIRRENAINLMGELGQSISEFALRARLGESPADIGSRLRAAPRVLGAEAV
jgi:transcriptional regulator with XRE-family HTH domain